MTRRMVWMLATTTAFEALRAGAGTFRALLDLPARARIGAVAFADFSQSHRTTTGACVLDGFTRWTVLRIVCADVSFLAVLGALTYAALARTGAGQRS